MKRFSFLMIAAAGLLFNACSDDTVAEGGGKKVEGNADGYMALNINLPTASSSMTRGDNDQFADGTSPEYEVKDCALLIFEGSSESSAKLVCAYDAKFKKVSDSDNDNITTSYKVVAQISGYESKDDLYALAVLNYKNVMDVTGTGVTFKSGVTAGTTASDGKFNLSTFHGTISGIDLTKNNDGAYFFMTNAVLSKSIGGSIAPLTTAGNIIQLAKLNDDAIYNTQEDALNNPAGEILVERAVAKATLQVDKVGNQMGVSVEEGDDDNKTTRITLEFDKVEWVIDNIEPSTYIARNPGDNTYIGYKSGKADLANPYRFVSHTTTKDKTTLGTDVDYYRTYWCVDPQYTTDEATTSHNLRPYGESPINSGFISAGATPLYCYENTFDVKNQIYKNTTRAVIKATAKGGTFYTIDGNYYLKTDYNEYEDGNGKPEKGSEYEPVKSFVCNYGDFKQIVRNELNDEVKQTFDFADIKDLIKVTYTTDLTTKIVEVGISFDKNGMSALPEGFKPGTTVVSLVTALEKLLEAETGKDPVIVEEINDQMEIYEYTNGEIYYEARFKHFGDELTPWNDEEYGSNTANKPSAGGVDKAYPGCTSNDATVRSRAANNYLGRYGMVRNNWYDVEVTAFKKIGYPAYPSLTTNGNTPDDSLDEFISCKVHVLAWAKRTQKWEF